MPSARHSKPLHAYFPPDLVRVMEKRIAGLGLRRSDYFAILLRNAVYFDQPRVASIKVVEKGDLVRDDMAFSIDIDLWDASTVFAKSRNGTLSNLLEMLVTADTASPSSPLSIWPSQR